MIVHYQILDMVFTDGKHRGTQLIRERLLELLRECLASYTSLDLSDLRRGSFTDGLALSALVHYHKPALLDFGTLNRSDAKGNLTRVFDVLFQHFDVPRLLDADDLLAQELPDETSMMIYLAISLSTLAQASERSASVVSAPELSSSAAALRPALLRLSTHTKFVREEQLDDILNSMFALPASAKAKTLTQTMKRQATLERQERGSVGVHKFDQLIRAQVPRPGASAEPAQPVANTRPAERRAVLAERLQLVDYATAAAAFHAPILTPAMADVDKIKVILEELTAFGSGPLPDPTGPMKAGTGAAVLVTQQTCKAAADALRGMLKPMDELVKSPASAGQRTGREADEIALGVPLFAANLIHELARAGARTFDLSNCIACVRRIVGMVRAVMTLTKDGISQFEAVNYAKNFLVQTVQLVVVLGVVAQTAKSAASPPQTLCSAVKNVVNALRKLLCALKLTADQELRQKQRLRSLFSELDRPSGSMRARPSPSPSPTSASPLSVSSMSPSSPSAQLLSVGSPVAPPPAQQTSPRSASPHRPPPAPAAAPLIIPIVASPPPLFPAPVPTLNTAAATKPAAGTRVHAARRSSRTRTYDRLIARLAEDCRRVTVELKPTAAEFREKRFADALQALLSTHRSAVGILTVYLGSGSALKRLLVAGTALDMAANEVVINAAPPGVLYNKARHNFKICLKDFLATIRSSTLLLSAAASPRTAEQTSAAISAPISPSSAARYTLVVQSSSSSSSINSTASGGAGHGNGAAGKSEEAARKGQIQRVSAIAQNVIRSLRGAPSAEFIRTFDFALVQELLKTLATLLSSLRIENRTVRLQLVEATRSLVQHSKKLKLALDVQSVEDFLMAKAPFLTALKAVLTTLLTLARQR